MQVLYSTVDGVPVSGRIHWPKLILPGGNRQRPMTQLIAPVGRAISLQRLELAAITLGSKCLTLRVHRAFLLLLDRKREELSSHLLHSIHQWHGDAVVDHLEEPHSRQALRINSTTARRRSPPSSCTPAMSITGSCVSAAYSFDQLLGRSCSGMM